MIAAQWLLAFATGVVTTAVAYNDVFPRIARWCEQRRIARTQKLAIPPAYIVYLAELNTPTVLRKRARIIDV